MVASAEQASARPANTCVFERMRESTGDGVGTEWGRSGDGVGTEWGRSGDGVGTDSGGTFCRGQTPGTDPGQTPTWPHTLPQASAAHIVRRFARLHYVTINGEKMPTRKASAIWEKGLQNGKGSFKGESGTISGNYSFGSRFESAAGSNPEELLAAAEAACFSMALALGLEKNGTPAEKVETSAACTIEKSG